MSLKAFHIVFVAASTLLALGIAGWSFTHYFSVGGTGTDLIYGCASVVAAIALAAYGKYVLKKLKNISYL